MKRTLRYAILVIAAVMMLSSPAWAGFLDRLYTKIMYNDINLGVDPTGPRITGIVELTVDLGGTDVALTSLETTSLPLWSELTFKAKLASHDPYPDEWLALHRRHVRFNFYDSSGTLVYTERDNTNAHGLAKIKLPGDKLTAAGKLSGITYLEVVYEGNQGSKSNRNGSGKLYPCRKVVALQPGSYIGGGSSWYPPPDAQTVLPNLRSTAHPLCKNHATSGSLRSEAKSHHDMISDYLGASGPSEGLIRYLQAKGKISTGDDTTEIIQHHRDKKTCMMQYFYSSNEWVESAETNHIVNVGDSIFAFSQINEFLQERMRTTFPTFATSACLAWETYPWKPSVRTQYEKVADAGLPARTIIMDGGANDVLVPGMMVDIYDCFTPPGSGLGETCRNHLNGVGRSVFDIWRMMASNGVKDIFFLGIHHPKAGKVGCSDLKEGELNAIADYANDGMKYAAKIFNDHYGNGHTTVTFLDLRDIIVQEDIIEDGLHLSPSGSRKVATLIWNAMADRGLVSDLEGVIRPSPLDLLPPSGYKGILESIHEGGQDAGTDR